MKSNPSDDRHLFEASGGISEAQKGVLMLKNYEVKAVILILQIILAIIQFLSSQLISINALVYHPEN